MFRKKKKKEGAEEGAEEAASEEAAKPEKTAKPETPPKKEEKPAKKEEGGEAEQGAEGAEGEGEAGHKKSKRKLIFIAGGAVAVILIVVGLLLSGVFGGSKEEEKPAAMTAGIDHPVYYELPQFLVNLSAPGNRVSFLKMSVTLELRDEAAVAVLEASKPRVLDSFNTYLRELRPADVQGSAGIYRLREELMARINGTIEEGLVKDILFSEIIVQ